MQENQESRVLQLAPEKGEPVEEVDQEQIELENRVKQWLKSSSLPVTTSEMSEIGGNPEKCTPKGPEKSVQNVEFSLKRSKSLPGMSNTNDFNENTLYHPDFVDWKKCESESSNAKSPPLLGILSDAHFKISQIFELGNRKAA